MRFHQVPTDCYIKDCVCMCVIIGAIKEINQNYFLKNYFNYISLIQVKIEETTKRFYKFHKII